MRVGLLSALTLSLAVLPGLQGAAPLGALPGPAPDRVVLHGNVHPAVRDLMPLDRTDPGLAMDHMILAFQMRPEARTGLERLLADQQDPASPRFHQWLTPEQFAAAFGPRPDEIAHVCAWLREQGFTVDDVSRGGMTLTFSGTAAQVETAFRTSMMEYRVRGLQVHANAVDPSVPAELVPLVAGVVSLHNIPRQAAHTRLRPLSLTEQNRPLTGQPQVTDRSGNHFLAPGDFATIYNLGPLSRTGINGAGVTIAIVGRTNPGTSDWVGFRNAFGLSGSTPTIQIGVTDPKSVSADENTEANLDVEWSWAVAQGAVIKFVCSASTASTDGIDLSAQYVVNHAVGSVMSTSFGSCESAMGTAENKFYNNLWAQAAAQGITSLVAAGDAGAAGCDPPEGPKAGTVAAVNGLSTTPYNVCVGGTMFNEGAGTYWGSAAGLSPTALSYIPEAAWNESGPDPSTPGDFVLWAGGGGASSVYAKPSWQVAPGVPGDGRRDVPDVSLAAGGNDAYIIYDGGGLIGVGGTSASTPAFAGLMALVVQKAGQAQGNPNPTFYYLGNAQYAQGGPGVFHDTTSGNNSVPGVTGFAAGVGYDLATGLGSVDATQLVNLWSGTITTPHASVGLLAGTQVTLSATVNGAVGSAVTWSATGGTLTPTGANTATFSAASAGTYTVTAASAAASALVTPISVVVHDADLLGAGQTPTGLDVLDVLGYYGTSSTAGDLNGDGTVDSADVNLLLNLLWKN